MALSVQGKSGLAAAGDVAAGDVAAGEAAGFIAPRPRHIVAIPSWYKSARGSGGGYFRDQALALQAAGHRVAMLAPDIFTPRDLRHGRAPPQRGRLRIENDGVPTWRRELLVVAPRLPYRNALAMAVCALRLFGGYCRAEDKPDLVHAHAALNAGVAALAIKRRYGTPYVLTEHSTAFAQERLRPWEHRLVRRVAAEAELCLAPSLSLAALLGELFPASCWHCLPNPLGEAFLGEPSPKPARGRGFVFFNAGRLTPEKGHALLIDGFAEAFGGDPGTRLRLAGDGPLRPALETLSRERGVASQVDFLGDLPSEAVRDEMAAADAFVLASDVETFGLVVVEALACGRPVIATASGGPEHLVDPSNGIIVPPRDRGALAEALRKMRLGADAYDAAAIRAAALGAYGPAAFARRFSALLDQRRASTSAGFAGP